MATTTTPQPDHPPSRLLSLQQTLLSTRIPLRHRGQMHAHEQSHQVCKGGFPGQRRLRTLLLVPQARYQGNLRSQNHSEMQPDQAPLQTKSIHQSLYSKSFPPYSGHLQLVSEVKIHQSLKHPHIVEFKHTFEDNQNVYILLQICPNHTLNDLLKRKKRLTESEIQVYMLQLLDALIHLHDNKIIHRDLKLGNLFLSENMSIKLGDFGLASKIEFTGDKRKTICGTPNYIAPEILESKGHSYQVDIWSFGVIMYTLAFGRPPFEAKDIKQTYKKIKLCLFNFPQSPSSSQSLKSLISSILRKDPAKRPSLKEIKEHEFFRGSTLSRQASVLLRAQSSNSNNNSLIKLPSYKESNKQLSDNGKMYTNNDLAVSKDLTGGAVRKDRLQEDRFTNTDRNASCFKTPAKPQKIQRVKSQRVFKEATNKENRDEDPLNNNQVSVKKWIDYSSKYGIGYLLNNKSYGVYFNDSTKIVAQGEEHFFYIERLSREDVLKKYTFADYPLDLKKKVGLFNHFKGYLKDDDEKLGQSQSLKQNVIPLDLKNLVYIKRWFRSKHSVIFRMSNKSVQVIFVDQTEVIINSSAKTVLYYNKNHERFDYAIHEVMHSQNKQLIKRFQYTKEVLNEMAKANQQKKEQDDGRKKEKSIDKVLQEKGNFSNTMHTPKKSPQEYQYKYLRLGETSSVKKYLQEV